MLEDNYNSLYDDFDSPPPQPIIIPSKEVTSPQPSGKVEIVFGNVPTEDGEQGGDFGKIEVELKGTDEVKESFDKAGVDWWHQLTELNVAKVIRQRLEEDGGEIFYLEGRGIKGVRPIRWDGQTQVWELGDEANDEGAVRAILQGVIDELENDMDRVREAVGVARSRGMDWNGEVDRLEKLKLKFGGQLGKLVDASGASKFQGVLRAFRSLPELRINKKQLNKSRTKKLVLDEARGKWMLFDLANGKLEENSKEALMTLRTGFRIKQMQEFRYYLGLGRAGREKLYAETKFEHQLLGRYYGIHIDPERAYRWIRATQEILAYASVPGIEEQIFVELVGPPQVGKSKILELMLECLGDLGGPATIDYFLLRSGKHKLSDTEFASYIDKSFINPPEPPKGAILDDSKIKGITGGKATQVRQAHRDAYEAEFTATIFIDANHESTWTEKSGAMERRVIYLRPLVESLPDAEKIKDLVPMILAGEQELFLLWIMDGWQRYKERGKFDLPEEAKGGAEVNRLASSSMGDFIENWTTKGKWVKETDLFKHYQKYVMEMTGRTVYLGCDKKQFTEEMKGAIPGLMLKKTNGGYPHFIGMDIKRADGIIIERRGEEIDYGE